MADPRTTTGNADLKDVTAQHLEEKHETDGSDVAVLGERGVWEATNQDAQAASQREHSLGVWQALQAYPFAVLWSLAISMSIIMEGYDTILIGSLYAYPSYKTRFGALENGEYQIPAKWQSAMGSGPQAGAIIGAFANGIIVQRYGYRKSLFLGLVLMSAFVFVSFFGMSVELQAVGQILCGSVQFYLTASQRIIFQRLIQ